MEAELSEQRRRGAQCAGFVIVAAMAASACGGPVDADGERSATVSAAVVTTLDYANASGMLRTGMLRSNVSNHVPFFTSFGTNGRACIHCHLPGQAWTVSAEGVAFRFTHPLDVTKLACIKNPSACAAEPNAANYGNDPIFRLVDGANSPTADVSTADKRRVAYSMLITKGLIRVGIGIPPGGEFELAAVSDPYGYASAAELSLFRRPLPTTNLRLAPLQGNTTPLPVLTGVMWDGRETLPGHDILFDLMDQANGATLGHAQATAGLSDADRATIVDFETGIFTAQVTDNAAGDLTAGGAGGGPLWLAKNQTFYAGINDVFGDPQTQAPFNPDVFTLYSAWSGAQNAARAKVARGQALFNRKPITIRGVAGLNDLPRIAGQPISGTCTTCHDSPNFGHHSVALAIDIGLTDASRWTPDLPLYTLRNRATGETRQTTDPGRALISGRWADIGKMKGPILRGLAGRAPYFHNGSAASLLDAVNFYDVRFGIGFTPAEKGDLVAFLQTL